MAKKNNPSGLKKKAKPKARKGMFRSKEKTKLLIATHNSRKRCELRTILKDFKDVVVTNYDDLPVAPPIIVEDGHTFRENAIKKAVTMSRFFDGLVLADDSGLEVAVLEGKPGVRSARFARKNAADEENNAKLLTLMAKIPEKNRHATFVCHLALAKSGSLLETFEGIVKGRILFGPRGANGFGYDPLFVPNNYEKTFAEMAPDFKNQISHRGIALKKLQKAIRKFL